MARPTEAHRAADTARLPELRRASRRMSARRVRAPCRRGGRESPGRPSAQPKGSVQPNRARTTRIRGSPAGESRSRSVFGTTGTALRRGQQHAAEREVYLQAMDQLGEHRARGPVCHPRGRAPGPAARRVRSRDPTPLADLGRAPTRPGDGALPVRLASRYWRPPYLRHPLRRPSCEPVITHALDRLTRPHCRRCWTTSGDSGTAPCTGQDRKWTAERPSWHGSVGVRVLVVCPSHVGQGSQQFGRSEGRGAARFGNVAQRKRT